MNNIKDNYQKRASLHQIMNKTIVSLKIKIQYLMSMLLDHMNLGNNKKLKACNCCVLK